MTVTLSYFTIVSIAYLIAAFCKDFSFGFWIAFTVHAVWIGLEGFGILISPWEELVFFYIAATAFALLGFAFVKVWHHPPVLNGIFLNYVFGGFDKSKTADSAGIMRVSIKMITWLLLQIGAIIIFESQWPGFVAPWPGVVANVILILLYLLLYFLLRNETMIFTTGQNEVASYCFWLGLPQVVLCLMYWILQLILSSAMFFSDHWDFYSTLIAWGVFIIIIFATGAAARRGNMDQTYQPVSP